jgi:hypothetical protein
MARSPKSTGRPFKKGESGNPKGSSARRKELGKVTALTNEQVLEVGSMILEGNMQDLHALAADPEATVLKQWLSSLILKSVTESDAPIFTAVMARMLGKPKEAVEVSNKDGERFALDLTSRSMTTEDKIREADMLALRRKEVGDD